MKYIKNRQEYIDFYDLLTIEECLQWIELVKESGKKIQEIQKPEKLGYVGALAEIALYFKKGENYRKKEKTIDEWMERDKRSQEKYDNTHEPQNVFCNECNYGMKLFDKTLNQKLDDKPRMLFFFECPHCKKRKGIFEDGENFETDKKCPQCGSILDSKTTKKDEIITITDNCKKCDYGYKDVWDFKADEEKSRKEKERQKYLLDNFRSEFCLSEKEGEEYVMDRIRDENFKKRENEQKKKEDDPKYQKAMKLRKIKVIELQKIIEEVITKNEFNNLIFDKPETDRQIIIPFSVQETKNERSGYDGSRNLKRAIIKVLENTNWRLMSDGISERLGILSGKLKGYEKEEDLVKIVKQ